MKDKVIFLYLDLRTISTLTLRKSTFGFGNLKTNHYKKDVYNFKYENIRGNENTIKL